MPVLTRRGKVSFVGRPSSLVLAPACVIGAGIVCAVEAVSTDGRLGICTLLGLLAGLMLLLASCRVTVDRAAGLITVVNPLSRFAIALEDVAEVENRNGVTIIRTATNDVVAYARADRLAASLPSPPADAPTDGVLVDDPRPTRPTRRTRTVRARTVRWTGLGWVVGAGLVALAGSALLHSLH